MSDEQLDDSDFFQQDFTTASEWEVFNARLEEQIHEWKLPFVESGAPLSAHQLSLCDWTVSEEHVTFADVDIVLTRYRCDIPAAVAVESDAAAAINSEVGHPTTVAEAPASKITQAFADLLSTANNYALLDERADTALHPLARWYGLRDFVVVAPARKPITNESQISIMLSSLHIAVAESGCCVPVFFQAMELRQHVYSGVCESRTHRLCFDVVHLRHVPPSYKYLTGLLDMFKSKVDTAYVNAVQVSVRLAFSLTRLPPMGASSSSAAGSDFDFESGMSPADMAALDEATTGDEDGTYAATATTADTAFKLRPFRVSIDPMTELRLFCLWPQVADNVAIDSQNYTDFDALRAPVWRLRCRFDAPTICRMAECLTEYLQRHDDRQTLADLLGNGFNMLGDEAERNPFDILTESKITTVLPSWGLGGKGGGSGTAQTTSASTKKKTKKPQGPNKLDGPLQDDLLMQMLYYMFPDAQRPDVEPKVPAYELPGDDAVSNLYNYQL